MPEHCLVYDKDELIALMPMYRKTHSHGEYVFDFEWANAKLFYNQYVRAGSYFSNSDLAAEVPAKYGNVL